MHRFRDRKQHYVTAAVAMATIAGTAWGIDPVLDFGVQDQASYEVFCNAIRASEHVRYDYVTNQNPRVVGAATALMVYATRNPMADVDQLAAFVTGYDAMLAAFAPGDSDLLRSSNLLTSLRFVCPESTGDLIGTDTRVGKEVIGLLGLDVPEPDNYDSMKRRMVQFDRARVRSFSNASAWMQMLVIGFSGQDLNGAPNAHVAGVLQAYLESQGFEPMPDGSPDDVRFNQINQALSDSLPADYASYEALLAEPIETSAIWSSIRGAFDVVAQRTQGRIDDFHHAMMTEPTLIEGLANANDPGIMDQLLERYRDQLGQVAQPRTVVAANALFMLQSADPSVRELAERSLDFSESQLDVNNTMAGVSAGVEIVGGLAQAGIGIYTSNPGDAIEGLTSAVLGSIGIADAFGAGGPSVEEQIFDEMVEMRDQLEDVRVEMNMRFNRIEDQLDVIYDSMATGFNALGNQIGDLTEDVEDLSREMMIARAALERIEDALWGMSSDILDSYIAVLANDMLDYRDDNGLDLPYNGPTSFLSGLNGFFTVGTFHARDTETFAGDFVSTLTVANADQILNGESIGRNINDLRVFPVQLGRPVLLSRRVVAPAPWSQAACAYAQMARESPWYFAYKYESELAGGGTPPELDVLIGLGEDLALTAAHGRSAALFNALFDGYDQAAADILARIDTVRAGVLTAEGVPFVDPWGGVGQEVASSATPFTMLDGQNGLDDYPLPTGIGAGCWNIYGFNNFAELISVLVKPIAASLGGSAPETHRMFVTDGWDGDSNDFAIEFRYQINGNANGTRPDLNITRSRSLRFRMYSSGDSVNINSDSLAMDLFDEDLVFWVNLRGTLLNGQYLLGQSIHLQNGNGDNIRLDVVEDSTIAGVPFVYTRLGQLQDAVWTAAANDSVVQGLSPLLPNYESLIEAYATLALPDMLEDSTVARACLRADPASGQLSLRLAGSVSDELASMVGDGDNGSYDTLANRLATVSSVAHDEINEAISRPAAGQSFVDWSLAELRDLRDNVFTLAIDDTYRTSGTHTLVVSADHGVMANDVDQAYRNIFVDTNFVNNPAYVAPMYGTVSMNDDGSFTYIPGPDFAGSDTFTYRTHTTVTAGGTGPIYSDPAVVVIVEGEAAGCNAADFSPPFGALDFFDVQAFLAAFAAENPSADIIPDELIDFFDVQAFLNAYSAGCP